MKRQRYTISYTMLTGPMTRDANSPLLALMDVLALQVAGASKIKIVDAAGEEVTAADLKLLTGR